MATSQWSVQAEIPKEPGKARSGAGKRPEGQEYPQTKAQRR